jgi:hypothetical protein
MNEEQNLHNEANFKPEEYEVVAYLDNRPPQFCPFAGANMQQAAAMYEAERAHWNQEINHYFPHRAQGDPDQNIHKCRHCGNTNVRYIVACLHIPSGKNVVFGDICVDRLSFANRSEFKAAQVRARAEQNNARLRVYAARVRFLDQPENAEFKAALEDINHEAHKRNDFARDIVAKFNQYGSVSARQIECFISSLKRDHEYAARKAAEAQEVKGPVPTGRVEFNCEVLSTRIQESQFGETVKMLVKLENNSRVWVTVPSACGSSAVRGAKLRIRATVEASKDDPSFGFGKRPTLLKNEAEVTA